MPTREDVSNALIGLAKGVTWGSVGPSTKPRGFALTDRRIRSFDSVGSEAIPALFQVEPAELTETVRRLGGKRIWRFKWIIYHNAGQNPDAIPSTETNLILDAIDKLFPQGDPDLEPDMVQTLGGLVQYAYIEGETIKDSGDLDQWGLIAIPINVLVP